MNRPDRFVSDLTADEISTLNEMIKNHCSYRVRRRAHAVLLSSEKFAVDAVSSVCRADRDTVCSWLKAWETEGIRGLYDLPRSGAPPKLTESDIEIIGQFIKEYPNSPKVIPAKSIEKNRKKIQYIFIETHCGKTEYAMEKSRKNSRKTERPGKI